MGVAPFLKSWKDKRIQLSGFRTFFGYDCQTLNMSSIIISHVIQVSTMS